jgi:hypothetical protein
MQPNAPPPPPPPPTPSGGREPLPQGPRQVLEPPKRARELPTKVRRLPRYVLFSIVGVIVAVVVLSAAWGLGAFGAGSASGDTSGAGPAAVHSAVGFADNSNRSVTSPAFSSGREDAVFVWISLFEYSRVDSVTDSAGDSFHSLASSDMQYSPTDAYNGLAIWAATNVSGGPAVTVSTMLSTTCSTCVIHSAIVVVDVQGVSANPIERVGTLVNSTNLPNEQSRSFSCSVAAPASAFVIAGVAARNLENFTAAGNESMVKEQGTVGTGLANSMTTAVFVATQDDASGPMWLNATSVDYFAWVAGAIAL